MSVLVISSLVVIVIAVIVIAVYKHQCLLRDRAQMMRDAMHHNDFTFRLPTKGLLFGEKALQEALNEAGQDIKRLIAHNEVESWQRLTRVLTHEIMNATAPIQSISQAYLANPYIKGTPYEEGIQAIHDTSAGLAAFVDSYRKLTQMQEPVMQELNLRAFCNSLSVLYPNVKWNIEIPDAVVVKADENLLRQTFINLVKNAIEANARTIDVRHISSTGASANVFGKLQISNDGHVIPDDVAREIFIPFFTTKQTGSGIGLSLSRQILIMQKLSLSLRERPANGYNVTFEIENER